MPAGNSFLIFRYNKEIKVMQKKVLEFKTSQEAIAGVKGCPIAQGEANDCFVRAMAAAYKIPYHQAHAAAADIFKREPRKGTRMVTPRMEQLNYKLFDVQGTPLEKKEITTYYINRGELTNRRMTVGTFVKTFPTGTYILLVRGHAFTIIDGVVVGNASDATKHKVRIQSAWRVG